MSLLALWALSALALALGAIALWLRSLRLRDASIVDSWWGPAFVLVAALGAGFGAGALERRLLVFALVALWGIRLGLHIHRRNAGKGEDYRYRAMRERHGERFGRQSLWRVFLLQASLALVIAAPLVRAATAAEPVRLGPFDVAGALLFAVGFLFEAVGDRQLARFKADPAQRGQVMDRGLWRYTRHPNYFGDATLWWGLWLIQAPTAGGLWTAIGPALMSFLLVRVSGAALLEKGLTKSKPAYADYVRRTSAFVPWFPRPKG